MTPIKTERYGQRPGERYVGRIDVADPACNPADFNGIGDLRVVAIPHPDSA